MDQNFTHINEDLLAKHLLGEATLTESEQVLNWAKSHPDHLRQLEDFEAILEKSKLVIDNQIDEHKALERLNVRLDRNTKVRRIAYQKVLGWVAVLAIFVSGSWFFYHNLIGNHLDVRTNGNTLTKVLPDGSTINLNKHSSLSYVGGFFNNTREVRLIGEAFFEVSADKSRPFIIHVNDVEVTVVGTAFNVKGNNDATVVVVESGIVKVNNQKDSVRLTAGEKVEARQNQPHLVKEKNQGRLYSYYYSNELVCDATPLSELVSVLNEKFKANIVISNPSIKQLPISTTFKNESLGEILKVIGETFNIKAEYGQGVIKLK